MMHTYSKTRTWVSKEGVKVLRKVQKAILRNPDAYWQDRWHCGTAMCIAGHAAVLSGLVQAIVPLNKIDPALRRYHVRLDHPEDTPMKVPMVNDDFHMQWSEVGTLAIGAPSFPRLFNSAWAWPAPFDRQMASARSHKQRAKIAVKRIDHFIDTGQ